MAKARVKYDRNKIIDLIMVGYSDRQVAEAVGSTRQNINLVRQQLKKKGLVGDQQRGRPTITGTRPNGDKAPDYDAVMQFVIEAVAAKQREPALKAELEKYKKGYHDMKEYAESLEKEKKKKTNWEQQYRLAVQKGELPKLD